MPNWFWDIDVRNLYGKPVKVETKDGIYLDGVFTNLITESFVFDNVAVEVPSRIELDKDPEKQVDISRIKSVIFPEVEDGQE